MAKDSCFSPNYHLSLKGKVIVLRRVFSGNNADYKQNEAVLLLHMRHEEPLKGEASMLGEGSTSYEKVAQATWGKL